MHFETNIRAKNKKEALNEAKLEQKHANRFSNFC